MAKNRHRPSDPPPPPAGGVAVLPPDDGPPPGPIGPIAPIAPAADPPPEVRAPEPAAADPAPEPVVRPWAYEVHNALVGFAKGTVHAATEAEARAAVARWLTAGLSVREG